MEQKKRDRIAWVLAIVLTPLLLYYLATNLFNVGRRRPPPPPAPVAAGVDAAQGVRPLSALLPPAPAALEPGLDPGILDEQHKIAMRLPRQNPFSASRGRLGSLAQSVSAESPARSKEAAFRVTAIVSRSGSKPMAMINGQLLGEGDRIGEWTVFKVNPQGVILDNGTRQMVLGAK